MNDLRRLFQYYGIRRAVVMLVVGNLAPLSYVGRRFIRLQLISQGIAIEALPVGAIGRLYHYFIDRAQTTARGERLLLARSYIPRRQPTQAVRAAFTNIVAAETPEIARVIRHLPLKFMDIADPGYEARMQKILFG